MGSGGGAKDVGDGDGEVEENGEEGVRSLQTCQRVVYMLEGRGHKGGRLIKQSRPLYVIYFSVAAE